MSSRGADHVMDSVYGDHLPKRLRQGSSNLHVSRKRLLESMYIRMLTEMCVSRFKWEGVPPEIDSRFIEMELFNSGLVVWHYDDFYQKHVVQRAASIGFPNLYDNPTSYTTFGNGTPYPQRILTRAQCVPIWANSLRRTDQDIIQVYAWRLAEIDRTIEINVQNARHPKVIAGTQNEMLGLVNISRQMDEGVPVIQVDREQFDPNTMITALDLGMHPDHIEKLDILHTRTWSKAMGMLGIDNANQDKKERLVASEVDANAQQVYSIKRMNLNEREKAVDRINRKYPDLDLAVSYHVDSIPQSVAGAGPVDNPVKVY